MSRLNGKGPEDDGITMGRGLGNCFEKRKQTSNQYHIGVGMGKCRKSGGGEGQKKRIKEGAFISESKISAINTRHAFLVDVDKCTGCGVCVQSCPEKAIQLIDNKAYIINDICRKCGKCVKICPIGAIS